MNYQKEKCENNICFYICVPVYKVEKYIKDCIESVLNQSYPNFRLILIDDGSPDNCGVICDKYADLDERVTVIHQKNLGLIAARQVALRKVIKNKELRVDSSFVIFLDSDDSLKKNALEIIKINISKTACDMLIYGMDRVVNGKIITSFDSRNAFSGVITENAELCKVVLNDSSYNSLCRKAISVQLISEDDYSEFYHIQHAEDLLQSLNFYKRTKKTVFIKDSLYNYTVNPDSITQSVVYENYNVDSKVRKTVLRFIEEESVWSQEELDGYLKYCRRILIGEVKTIANFDTKYKNKSKLFDEILEDDYFAHILNSEKKLERILKLFKERNFRWIIFECKFKKALAMYLRKFMRRK